MQSDPEAVVGLLEACGVKRTEITANHMAAAERALTAFGGARKYSVAEIDRMRNAVYQLYPEWYNPKPAQVEDRLRTYMLNGNSPEELEANRHASWADVPNVVMAADAD